LSRARRGAIVAAAGYLVSPIDLVPGVIPVAGQLDDVLVALAALRFALAGLSPEQRREHLDDVGLTERELDGDVSAALATLAWLARAGARLTTRVALATAVGVARGVTLITRAAVKVVGTALAPARSRR
jgi:hypothetical protein